MTAAAVRQRLPPGLEIARHRHAAPYAALVLAGGYEEAGDGGRVTTCAGIVVLHDAFGAHLNRRFGRGCEVLNLTLSLTAPVRAGIASVDDADQIARAAEQDAGSALAMLLQGLTPLSAGPRDWPDALASALNTDPGLCLGDWARSAGLAPATVSRGFRQVFGVSPGRFRLEARARRSWRGVVGSHTPLAAVAVDAGFADQAHMTRAVKAVTGATPGVWRASSWFKTAA